LERRETRGRREEKRGKEASERERETSLASCSLSLGAILFSFTPAAVQPPYSCEEEQKKKKMMPRKNRDRGLRKRCVGRLSSFLVRRATPSDLHKREKKGRSKFETLTKPRQQANVKPRFSLERVQRRQKAPSKQEIGASPFSFGEGARRLKSPLVGPFNLSTLSKKKKSGMRRHVATLAVALLSLFLVANARDRELLWIEDLCW
jgi:hypothetical protein